MPKPRSRAAWSSLLAGLSALLLAGAGDEARGRKADQEALKAYGELVGDWRGVGQVKRMSNKGAWTEESSWAWALTPTSAALSAKVDGGKIIKAAVLAPDRAPGTLKLDATLADGSARTFVGKAVDPGMPLVLVDEAKGDGPRRVTITARHGSRLIVLFEGRDGSGEYQRIGEVGSTRKGAAFAAGDGAPECIVTGGRGTMTVSYRGKSYPICCSGCRDLFNEDPAAVIADYEAKKKKADGK